MVFNKFICLWEQIMTKLFTFFKDVTLLKEQQWQKCKNSVIEFYLIYYLLKHITLRQPYFIITAILMGKGVMFNNSVFSKVILRILSNSFSFRCKLQ